MANILVIAAHPDDEMLGLEGTLIKHRAKGDNVYTLVVGSGRGTATDQRFDERPLIEYIDIIEYYLSIYLPTTIYTHYIYDRNLDHRIISEAVTTAARPFVYSGNILFFETPDGNTNFQPNHFEGIDIDKKLSNLDKKYRHEMREYPHPRSGLMLRALSQFRGTQCGKEYAEGFIVYRSVN